MLLGALHWLGYESHHAAARLISQTLSLTLCVGWTTPCSLPKTSAALSCRSWPGYHCCWNPDGPMDWRDQCAGIYRRTDLTRKLTPILTDGLWWSATKWRAT
eukprot:5973787-Pyramimonas_sp.AAC.1